MTRGLVAAVADGIGGLVDGHLASQGAMQAIRSAFLEGSSDDSPSDRLLTYAAAAQKSVLQINQTSNCGATLVSVLITGKTMQFLSIGDSRIYLYRAGALLQLNREHILRRTNEEKETFYGTGEKLTKKRAGALTSYLGKENLTLIDRSLQPITLLPGDRIALMSDGVFNTLSEREIMAHLRRNPETAAQEMIQDVDVHANPIQDNASVVVIGIE
jgi:protein phosphatase